MTTDSSVAMSLADLTKIEQERVEREQTEHARALRERAQEEQLKATARRSQEAAEAERRSQAEAQRARDEAVERVRAEARERAAAEVMRIEAEAKARLELDNAVRAHELAVLRTQRETGRRRREVVVSLLLAAAVGLGGVGAYASVQHSGKLERDVAELQERERASLRERDDAKRTELAALERRYDALASRSRPKSAQAAFDTAEAAQRGIDLRSPSRDQLRAFADALDALQSRLDTLDRLAALEKRHADLAAWSRASHKSDGLGDVELAARRASAPDASREALSDYERALDGFRQKLAERAGLVRGGEAGKTTDPQTRGTCGPDDPGCGLDGRRVF